MRMWTKLTCPDLDLYGRWIGRSWWCITHRSEFMGFDDLVMCSSLGARICSSGTIYMEMVANILQKLIKSGRTTVVRYDVHHEVQSSANHFIGRAAHIAVLDSEVFLEKFFCVSAAKYFRCAEKPQNGQGPATSTSKNTAENGGKRSGTAKSIRII